jgi:hypothetical protein
MVHRTMRSRSVPVLLLCALLTMLALPSATPWPAVAQTTPGTIAYVRGGTEIRLIEPDSTGDRPVLTLTGPLFTGITDLSWKPDASELAFASDHEAACSLYDSDIYAVRPDGSGYRRVTNAPACGALGGFPKGSVTVTVQNFTTRGPFYVYVQGAPSAQMVIVPQGGATTVTFTDVADFGATEQIAVVIEGLLRWIAPISAADVQPNQTVHAGTINVSGSGIRQYGGYSPSWHSDGSRLGYIFGGCAGMWQIGARPPAGAIGSPLLQAQNVFACLMDWGPSPALADQLLYYSALDEGIYRVTEGSADGGTRLVVTEPHELVIDLQWLPDGSGFVYTKTGDFLSNANVFRYDFATGEATPLTAFTDEFARYLSVSPDGQLIVFERAPAQDSPTADLWTVGQDGSDMALLVSNALRPAWSRQTPQVAPNYPVYLPQIR